MSMHAVTKFLYFGHFVKGTLYLFSLEKYKRAMVSSADFFRHAFPSLFACGHSLLLFSFKHKSPTTTRTLAVAVNQDLN